MITNYKRIFQITAYYPPHIGGMENFVKNLSEKLAKKKYSVEVITSDIGFKNRVIKKTNLTIHYLKSFVFLNTPISFDFMKELSKADSTDIFHLHIAQAIIPEMTALIANKKKVSLISHIHLDVGNTTGIGKILLPLYKNIFLKRVLQFSKKVIVQNDDYKRFIHHKYNVSLEKIKVVANAIDLLPEDMERYKNITSPYKILLVGRLVNQKRVDLFIEAIKVLKGENYSIDVEIVGDGPDKEKLEVHVKKLGLSNVIHFCGSLDKKKVAQKYKNAHCLVQTSERESFSTVLLESLNMGCPVVSVDIPGTRNILINKFNSVLSSSQPEKIAEAINLIITDNNLRKKIVKGGYKTVQKYGWEKTLHKLELIYLDRI